MRLSLTLIALTPFVCTHAFEPAFGPDEIYPRRDENADTQMQALISNRIRRIYFHSIEKEFE